MVIKCIINEDFHKALLSFFLLSPPPFDLPLDYSALTPTDPAWLHQNQLLANSYFLNLYPSLLQSSDPSLLLPSTLTPFPPSVVGTLTLGIQLPTATLTAVFPTPSSRFIRLVIIIVKFREM